MLYKALYHNIYTVTLAPLERDSSYSKSAFGT